jgi:hypothetical protein
VKNIIIFLATSVLIWASFYLGKVETESGKGVAG